MPKHGASVFPNFPVPGAKPSFRSPRGGGGRASDYVRAMHPKHLPTPIRAWGWGATIGQRQLAWLAPQRELNPFPPKEVLKTLHKCH